MKAKGTWSWVETAGHVTTSEVKEITSTDDPTEYRPRISYEYTVDAEPHKGDALAYNRFEMSSREEAENLIAHLTDGGDQVRVYYDPEAPENAVLIRGLIQADNAYVGLTAAVALSIAVAFVILVHFCSTAGIPGCNALNRVSGHVGMAIALGFLVYVVFCGPGIDQNVIQDVRAANRQPQLVEYSPEERQAAFDAYMATVKTDLEDLGSTVWRCTVDPGAMGTIETVIHFDSDGTGSIQRIESQRFMFGEAFVVSEDAANDTWKKASEMTYSRSGDRIEMTFPDESTFEALLVFRYGHRSFGFLDATETGQTAEVFGTFLQQFGEFHRDTDEPLDSSAPRE